MKQIAVVIGAINLSNQKKLLDGMIAAAKETDCNLYVFTNYVGSRETAENIIAANRILRLPDFYQFDGVVLAGNTMHNPPTVDRIVKEIQAYRIPAVSIDRELEGMSCVGISSYDAEFEVVEHFICHHGCRDIVYVTGPIQLSREAQLRYQAYCDALEKHGIAFSPDKVYRGMFTLESGTDVAKMILEEGRMPQAIICGNDDMAHGIMEVFRENGYRIPEDVRIAGFDNGDLSQMNKPALTTIDKNQFEVGYSSVHEVLKLIEGKEPENYLVSCKLECRESCGCGKKEIRMESLVAEFEALKANYVAQQHDILRMSDVVRGMTTDFSKVQTPDELIEVLKKYVPLMEMEKFYLCLCEEEKLFALPEVNLGQDIDILQVNEDYTPMIALSLAYEKGVFNQYPHFEKGIVLPKECRELNGGNVFVINSIFYQNCCYGYAICGNALGVVANGLYYSWLMEIGVGLENVRKWMLLKDAVDKLNGIWCYDSMTHLYNRSGFYYEADVILEQLKKEDKEVFIIFMDADGLKHANDTKGHEVGDYMIQTLAAVIHKNTAPGMLGMRYGGDEFVIFGGFGSEENGVMGEIMESIRQDISELNASGEYPFVLSASMGGSSWHAREIEDLSSLIEQADKQMYEEKRKKKQGKNEKQGFFGWGSTEYEYCK